MFVMLPVEHTGYFRDYLMAQYHLAILKKPYLNAIVSGQKRIESRFTKTKCPPFGRVWPGDKIFLKESSGSVSAIATVTAVKSFKDLTPDRIIQLKAQYNHDINGTDDIWRTKMDCRFGVLIWLKDVEPIEPVWINKKDWRAWVVLTEKENFGLLKINAEKIK